MALTFPTSRTSWRKDQGLRVCQRRQVLGSQRLQTLVSQCSCAALGSGPPGGLGGPPRGLTGSLGGRDDKSLAEQPEFVRFYFVLVWAGPWPGLKRCLWTSVVEDAENSDTVYRRRECTMVQLLQKTLWPLLRGLSIDSPCDPAIPRLGV